MLLKTQAENFGGQVDVPVGGVLLHEAVHHPVGGENAIKCAGDSAPQTQALEAQTRQSAAA